MASLTSLANAFGTDKGTLVREAHGYTGLYDRLFQAKRDTPLNFLEIGLCFGAQEEFERDRPVSDIPSVRMWLSYFPKAQIFRLDISDFAAFARDRFTFLQVDCGNAAALRAVAESGVTFDVIIDDGSHASFHQQLALQELFPALAAGGICIIEDLHWQPGVLEAKLPRVPKTADMLADPSHPWRTMLSDVASVRVYSQAEIRRRIPLRFVRRKLKHIRTCARDLMGLSKGPNPPKLAVIRKLRAR